MGCPLESYWIALRGVLVLLLFLLLLALSLRLLMYPPREASVLLFFGGVAGGVDHSLANNTWVFLVFEL